MRPTGPGELQGLPAREVFWRESNSTEAQRRQQSCRLDMADAKRSHKPRTHGRADSFKPPEHTATRIQSEVRIMERANALIIYVLLSSCPSPSQSYMISDLQVPFFVSACCVSTETCQMRLTCPAGSSDGFDEASDRRMRVQRRRLTGTCETRE